MSKISDTEFSVNGNSYYSVADFHKAYQEELQKALEKEFGDKMSVSLVTDTNGDQFLSFQGKSEDDQLVINCDAGKALGIGLTATSYLNTGKTLGELGFDLENSGLTVATKNGKADGEQLKDASGNPMYALEINGVTVGNYSKDTTLATILNDINTSDAEVKVSYSKLSGNFTFTAKETGTEQQIKIKDDGLANLIFGSTLDSNGDLRTDLGDKYVHGQDAKFEVTINGEKKSMTRSSNNVELDGLTLHLKDTFSTATTAYSTTGLAGTIQDGDSMTFSFLDANGSKQEITVDIANSTNLAAELRKNSNLMEYFNVSMQGGELSLTSKVEGAGANLSISRERAGVSTDVGVSAPAKTYNQSSAVSFDVSTDADPIVDAIKTMIADYNIMMGEIKKAYTTMPAQKSDGSPYEPLTEEDMADMTESAITKFEEKAKQGLLFGDSTLSSLYEKMRFIFSPGGKDGASLKNMGISTSYLPATVL